MKNPNYKRIELLPLSVIEAARAAGSDTALCCIDSREEMICRLFFTR